MHLHSLKKMWYLMELSGGESIGMVSSTEMKEHIMEECRKLRLPVVRHFSTLSLAKVLNFNGPLQHITILRQQSNYWLSVRVEKEKSKRKGTNKYYAPIFFAIPIDEPVMYTTTTKMRMTKGLVRVT
jgi:hypothetical protein